MDKIIHGADLKRKSGILLHPTSLPGADGIGEIGSEAYSFVDFLEESGQTLWQVLPLGPTGYGDSPYASFSTHAGNPMVISLQTLKENGLLEEKDFSEKPSFCQSKIDFGVLLPWKKRILMVAADRFLNDKKMFDKYKQFCRDESSWLEDYSLFMALKSFFDNKAAMDKIDGAMWSNYWDKDIALRESQALIKWKKLLNKEIEKEKVLQYFFFDQWLKLKKYANEKKISIVGDIPIFVASDSCDVWANREFFLLDPSGNPLSVAGVPPDYFSKTGQLWGNPLYNWDKMEKNNFKWWLDRIKCTLRMVDIVRVDHFRGFEAFWKVPSLSKTAIDGEWIKAPGKKLFLEIEKELGSIPILAEDLGLITEEVEKLRDFFNFPGMRILQFAFDSEEGDTGLNSDNIFLPHNYVKNSVVYTGTHDNATIKGWLANCNKEELQYLKNYCGYNGEDFVWLFIRMALGSVSAYSIIPMQDYLGLGDEARMNIPSTLGGNWVWRMEKGDCSKELSKRLFEITKLYGRIS